MSRLGRPPCRRRRLFPTLAVLDNGQQPTVAGLSRFSPGNCTVIGTSQTSGTQTDAMFAADEVNGT